MVMTGLTAAIGNAREEPSFSELAEGNLLSKKFIEQYN